MVSKVSNLEQQQISERGEIAKVDSAIQVGNS